MTNELEFMKYFENNLLHKNTASYDVIRTAADLIGYKADINCASCARNAYLELLNIYNRMLVPYEKLKAEEIKPIEPIYTKYEAEEIVLESPEIDKLPVGEYKVIVEKKSTEQFQQKKKTK
jgi:hypothetical protein